MQTTRDLLLCSPGWTRSNNPPVNSRMLCQLSYRGSNSGKVSKPGAPPLNRSALGAALVLRRPEPRLGGDPHDRIVEVDTGIQLVAPPDLPVTAGGPSTDHAQPPLL